MSHTSWEAGEVAQEVLPASPEEVVSWCQFWGRRDDQLDGWMYQDMNSYGYCLYGCGICSIWKSIPWVLMSICNDASQGMLLNAFDLPTRPKYAFYWNRYDCSLSHPISRTNQHWVSEAMLQEVMDGTYKAHRERVTIETIDVYPEVVGVRARPFC